MPSHWRPLQGQHQPLGVSVDCSVSLETSSGTTPTTGCFLGIAVVVRRPLQGQPQPLATLGNFPWRMPGCLLLIAVAVRRPPQGHLIHWQLSAIFSGAFPDGFQGLHWQSGDLLRDNLNHWPALCEKHGFARVWLSALVVHFSRIFFQGVDAVFFRGLRPETREVLITFSALESQELQHGFVAGWDSMSGAL